MSTPIVSTPVPTDGEEFALECWSRLAGAYDAITEPAPEAWAAVLLVEAAFKAALDEGTATAFTLDELIGAAIHHGCEAPTAGVRFGVACERLQRTLTTD